MALKTDIRGMSHVYPDYFVVGREKVREYAKAIKAEDPASFDEKAAADLGYDNLVAPLTFVSTLALLVQQHFFSVVDVGVETMQIVQVDQKFVFHKPVLAGDKLWARMDVHSVDERFGADIVVTRNILHQRRRRDGPGGVHHDDGSPGRRLDPGQVGSRDRAGHATGGRRAVRGGSGGSSGGGRQAVRGRSSGLVPKHLRRCTLGPRGFPT